MGVARGQLANLLAQWPTLAELARQAEGAASDEITGFVVFAILIGAGGVVGVWTVVYLLLQAVLAILRRL